MLCLWRCVHMATPSLVLVGPLRGWQQLCCKPSVESGVFFTSSSRHGGCPQAEPEANPCILYTLTTPETLCMSGLSRNHTLSTCGCQIQSCDKDELNLHCLHHPRSFVKLYTLSNPCMQKGLDFFFPQKNASNTYKTIKQMHQLNEKTNKQKSINIYGNRASLFGALIDESWLRVVQATCKCCQCQFRWEVP